ncbi:solute carrier organic anion transporter family member 2A1 [Calliopsis andreniformis]|uniref:solute carrier organic anion transporter family member 2A1 n=1 Tax=Calliopsis andreniformis TaxID=337506 RepID=UPI003FCCACC8
MTIRLQEVVRSETEGGLSGPANPIPSQSIDCGCAQLPCPKLARFATRRLFVGLLAWIGIVQAAAYVYLYVAGPTIARKFQFDPYVMEWVPLISDLTPCVFGVLIAYWGDRIHRAAWVGGIVLLQGVAFFIMIIPHLTHHMKVIEEPTNITHMSLYSDDNRELCSAASSRIIAKEDEPCYFTFAVIVIVQIVCGIANIAYFSLGISYLDDNTKKKHIAAFIGVIIAAKIVGILLGYILAWSCLAVDAVTLQPIESYREQIGAWWLGLPILTVLLIVPGLLLAWFPRMLTSEVVEMAAASLLHILDRYNELPRRQVSLKVGSPNFWPSMGRLLMNKILICNIIACILYFMALLNFMAYENLIIQSRFHVPKPIGMLFGFSDPMSSRLVSNVLKPILIALIVIISGLVITKAKPSARTVVVYSAIAILSAAGIIFALTATYCKNKEIFGTDQKGVIHLPAYCNKDCGCSNDAEFHPICDNKETYIFYSPCHAGCRSSEDKNGVTVYTDCSCIENLPGSEKGEAVDGPCNSSACQMGWLIFEFGSLLAYALVASTFVGDFVIALRSVHAQDKAISIGFWMMWLALIAIIPGKILYDVIANVTCRYWGTQKTTCHLHDSLQLGDYLCYLTGSLLVVSVLIKTLLYFFCGEMKLYVQRENPLGAEMQELMQKPAPKTQVEDAGNNNNTSIQVEVTNETIPKPTQAITETVQEEEEPEQAENKSLKYGPLGPGDRRTDSKSSLNKLSETRKSRGLETEDELSSTDDEGKKNSSPIVAYRPLDLDSDVESDLSTIEPRSRRRILSKDYDRVYGSDQISSEKSSLQKREFPNPDNYEDPRLSRQMKYKDQNGYIDGSSKTNSFEYSKKQQENMQKRGDFNEVGIPIVEHPGPSSPTVNTPFLKDVHSLITQYEQNAEQLADDQESIKSGGSGKVKSGIPLVAMAKRPPSRGQLSSGFNSLVDIKVPEDRPQSRESNSPKDSNKGSRGTIHTDF